MGRAAQAFPTTVVGLILIVDRNLPVEEAQKVADFAVTNKSTIVGKEKGFIGLTLKRCRLG